MKALFFFHLALLCSFTFLLSTLLWLCQSCSWTTVILSGYHIYSVLVGVQNLAASLKCMFYPGFQNYPISLSIGFPQLELAGLYFGDCILFPVIFSHFPTQCFLHFANKLLIQIFVPGSSSGQTLINLFCKKTNSKYFGFCGPCHLCLNHLTMSL